MLPSPWEPRSHRKAHPFQCGVYSLAHRLRKEFHSSQSSADLQSPRIRAGGRSTVVGRLAARAGRRGRARRGIVLATLRRVPLSRCLSCNFTVDAEWRIDGRVVVDNSRGFLLFISDLDTFVSAGAPARALSVVRSDCLSLDSRSVARLREFTAPHVVVDENALCIDWGNAHCAIVGQQIRLAVGGGDVTGLGQAVPTGSAPTPEHGMPHDSDRE
ncbi:hypothetical protein GQ600_25815 [Phytophthora cactorum]|nr:hypothetical protein GQ600_25815 [Phytophthora cactorum]